MARRYDDLGMSEVKITRNLSGPEQSYVHRTTLEPNQYVANVLEKIDEVGGPDDIASIFRRASDAPNSLPGQIKKAMELWSGSPIETAQDMRAALSSMRRMEIDGDSLQTRAGALLKREMREGAGIPDWLIEKDPLKAMTRWVNSTFRHLASRDSIAEMRVMSEALKETPFFQSYISNLATDLAGTRKGTLASWTKEAWQRSQLGLELEARRADAEGTAIGRRKAAVLRGARDFDKTMSRMTGYMYHYFLGANPQSALKNLAQPLQTTLPALGSSNPAVSINMLRRAYAKTGKDLLSKDAAGDSISKARAELHRRGLAPDSQTYDADRWMQEGMDRIHGSRASMLMHKAGQASMIGFDLADVTNRTLMVHMADDLIDALMAGRKKTATGMRAMESRVAAEAIASAEPGYRRLIMRHVKNGDEDKAKKALARYLNGGTQYNYNRAAMNKLGRSLGGAFSMFTKWPSVAAGDIVTLLDARRVGNAMDKERETMKALQKYFGPYIIATALATPWKDLTDDSPRARRLLGASGPSAWTANDALMTLPEFVGVDFGDRSDYRSAQNLFPPYVERVFKGVGGIARGDLGATADELGEAVISVLPNAVYLRFLLREVPELAFDTRLDGGYTTAGKLRYLMGLKEADGTK